MAPDVVVGLGVALGLGLLVGLQRERTQADAAGIRTFTLITLLGALIGVVSGSLGPWPVAAAAIALAAMVILGNVPAILDRRPVLGVTSEIAALVMYFVGVAVTSGYLPAGVIVAGVTALLLHWRTPLHQAVRRMEDAEVTAVMRLALIGLVILPALPDRSFGPYGVLNPFQIWLMVVLIVGISMAAYVAYRWLKPADASVAAGVLGGLISSTALTASYARQSRDQSKHAPAAVAVIVASAVVFARVLAEVALVAPALLSGVGPPLLTMGLVVALIAALAYRAAGSQSGSVESSREPPLDLRTPVVFGTLYAAVLLGTAATRAYFGPEAVYVVAALSGLTDVDAITLSTASLIEAGRLTEQTGWRVIIVGALSNMVFKGGVLAVLGSRDLLIRVGAAFAAAIAAGIAILGLWPG
jgi:uncharacterized membrane protein (DUF4010 family)